ncbi:MAG TPA: sigma-54 dependent transcriptional regulator [Candidatus Polarisedimenticolia bacterium]|nr:sigma-54 dependent transcriptional regulator [Candidatus Polarisedimenticolia bacterium]
MDRILVVEDKESLRTVLCKTLEAEGYQVDEAADVGEASRFLRGGRYLAVLTDLRLPGGSGHDVVETALEGDPQVPVIVMTAFGTIEDAVRAMKDGAFDFLAKPVDTSHLLVLVERAASRRKLLAENLLLKEEFARRFGMPRIVGESAPMVALVEQVQRVAPTSATVLLQGESGTGKELFARALHELSPRREGPFVAINCAAIPETLLENELFGHEKGAYTGAGAARMGKMEMADQGTIFLDEVGEAPLAVQAKLLRVLEERRFERVGGTATIAVDVRIVAASNRDLASAVAARTFREDLFFRLSVVPLTVPPLRDRAADIPALVEHFVTRYARELKRRTPPILRKEASERLAAYPWPGNVRELQNCIERAMILSDGGPLGPEHLHLPDLGAAGPARSGQTDLARPLAEVAQAAARAAERGHIERALQVAGGDRSRAAEILKVSARTLHAKIKDLGLGGD